MSVLSVVYDKMAEMYTAPIVFENNNCAQRWFETKVIDDVNASDYELYTIAEYDDKTAKIVLLDKPKLVFKGLSLVKNNGKDKE